MANSYTTRLKKRLPAVGDVNWDDEWHDNEKLDEVIAGALLSVNRVISGGAVTAGAGLNADWTSAVVWLMGTRLSIAAGSLAMTAAQAGQQLVNWLYVNASGVVTVSTSPPSGDYIPLALVDTNDLAIVRIADLRPMSALDKDAAGGVPGLTDLKINFMDALGTTKSFFTNANTVARTYTFPNRDGTIADGTDLALKAPLNSPAFTGAPTAPTPAATDSSTAICTTAHVDAAFLGYLAASGYQKFKNGMVIQWGFATCSATSGNPVAVTFPLAFTAVYVIALGGVYASTANAAAWTSNRSTTGFDIRGAAANQVANWVAIGFITPA